MISSRRVILVSFVLLVSMSGTFASTAYNVSIPDTLYGNLCQLTVPTIGSYACGPTAVANSFVYLENRYSSVYSHKLIPSQNLDINKDSRVDVYDNMIAVVQQLSTSDYMRTVARKYTYHDDLIWAKRLYMDQLAPGKTVYKAQDYWGWTNSQRPRPAFVQSKNPTWDFLYNELVSEADVEILLSWADGGHFVSVCGFQWNDLDSDGIIDRSENASITFMNPWTGALGTSDVWHSNGRMYTDYSLNSWISMVASSKPVPEPGTLIVMTVGVMGMAGTTLRKRRQ